LPTHTINAAGLPKSLRVDRFLAQLDYMPSRSRLKELFEEGKILVNGEPVKPSAKIQDGDVITADVPESKPPKIKPEPIPLAVLYEDKELIVIDKPAGMLVHPTPTTTSGTLVNALLHHCESLSAIGGPARRGIVHRLDKLTSGVMAAAKNDRTHHILADLFRAHSMDRRYLAVVYGEMERRSGVIESSIGRNIKHRTKMAGSSSGRRAVTHYRVLTRSGGLSLVECRLETGRTHQIRVHLSEMNHPVAGDPMYGKGRTVPAKLDPMKKSALRQLKRQALHAFHLGFEHPDKGWMAFQSPLPPDLTAVIKAFGLDKGAELPQHAGRVE